MFVPIPWRLHSIRWGDRLGVPQPTLPRGQPHFLLVLSAPLVPVLLLHPECYVMFCFFNFVYGDFKFACGEVFWLSYKLSPLAHRLPGPFGHLLPLTLVALTYSAQLNCVPPLSFPASAMPLPSPVPVICPWTVPVLHRERQSQRLFILIPSPGLFRVHWP